MALEFDPLPRHSAKSQRQQGGQYYLDAAGQPLPSVSTILNATRSPDQWDALMQWRQRVGEAEANRISSTASRRGTGTHKQAQRYLQGEVVRCSESVQPYWDSLKSVLVSVDQVRLVEGPVFHYELGYAGKVDCVASYDGIPCLCEWKTADRPKQTLDRLQDYPLQLAAYWGAVNYSYAAQGLDLQHALLAIAVPDQPAEVFWFDQMAMADYWRQWEQRVTLFWRRRGRWIPDP
jgi:hypothetical protein